MKVNISGVGLIPKVGLLAPVYGKDLAKDTVAVILNYASFKVYQASTGIRITKKNIDDIFGGAVKQAATAIPVTAPAAHTVPKKTKKARLLRISSMKLPLRKRRSLYTTKRRRDTEVM